MRPIRTSATFWCSLILAGVLPGALASAQTSSLFGNNSPVNGANGLGATTGSFGATGNPGVQGMTGGGLGGAGMSAAGVTGNAGSSLRGNSLGGQMAPGQQANGQGRFVGNRQSGQQQNGQFGNRNQFGQGQFGQNQFGQGGFGQGQFGQMNRQNRNNRNNQNQMMGQNMGGNMQDQPQIRPTLKVGFEAPAVAPEVSMKRLTGRFEKLATRKEFQGITLIPDGEEVVLRGQVKNNETRRLLQTIAQLDPAVTSVRNELTIPGETGPAPRDQ